MSDDDLLDLVKQHRSDRQALLTPLSNTVAVNVRELIDCSPEDFPRCLDNLKDSSVDLMYHCRQLRHTWQDQVAWSNPTSDLAAQTAQALIDTLERITEIADGFFYIASVINAPADVAALAEDLLHLQQDFTDFLDFLKEQ